jgi:hypothetical protein
MNTKPDKLKSIENQLTIVFLGLSLHIDMTFVAGRVWFGDDISVQVR